MVPAACCLEACGTAPRHLPRCTPRRYDVNWTASPYLDWGRNEGCGLPIYSSAVYRQINATQQYFCSGPASAPAVTTACTFNGMSQVRAPKGLEKLVGRLGELGGPVAAVCT